MALPTPPPNPTPIRNGFLLSLKVLTKNDLSGVTGVVKGMLQSETSDTVTIILLLCWKPDEGCQELPESLNDILKMRKKSWCALATRNLSLTLLRQNYVLANFNLQPVADMDTTSLN